jgi:outer membrane protein assembly factor BamA
LVFLGLLSTTRLVAQEEDDRGLPWRTSYFPYLGGGANDDPVLNFRVRYWQAAEYDDRVTANAALDAEVGATTRGSRHAFVRFRAPQLAEGWRFDAIATAAREVRLGYYGLGNDTEYNENLVTEAQPFLYRVRRTRYRGSVELTRYIRGPWMAAVMGDVERVLFTSLPGQSVFDADFEPDELKETDVSGRLALIYDSRDNEYNTHQGLLLEAGAQVGSGGDGYTRLYTLLRAYVMPREGTVVAARIGASGMGGTPSLDARYTIPGWERQVPVLGSQYSHRSLDTGRSTARHVLFGNLEVRHDLLAFGDIGAITLLAFTDAGRVFEDESFRITTDDLKVGGGGGVALRALRDGILTFNFAGGPDGFKFTMGSGWMF